MKSLIVWAAVHLRAEPITWLVSWHTGKPRCWGGRWQDSGCRPCWTTWTLKASASSQTPTPPGTWTTITQSIQINFTNSQRKVLFRVRTCPFISLTPVTIDYFGSDDAWASWNSCTSASAKGRENNNRTTRSHNINVVIHARELVSIHRIACSRRWRKSPWRNSLFSRFCRNSFFLFFFLLKVDKESFSDTRPKDYFRMRAICFFKVLIFGLYSRLWCCGYCGPCGKRDKLPEALPITLHLFIQRIIMQPLDMHGNPDFYKRKCNIFINRSLKDRSMNVAI